MELPDIRIEMTVNGTIQRISKQFAGGYVSISKADFEALVNSRNAWQEIARRVTIGVMKFGKEAIINSLESILAEAGLDKASPKPKESDEQINDRLREAQEREWEAQEQPTVNNNERILKL